MIENFKLCELRTSSYSLQKLNYRVLAVLAYAFCLTFLSLHGCDRHFCQVAVFAAIARLTAIISLGALYTTCEVRDKL